MFMSEIQNTLSKDEIRIIKELRKVKNGRLVVIKKDGVVVLSSCKAN